MFGIGKTKITPPDLARELFTLTVKELKQDRIFAEQVKSAGLDYEIFSVEFLSLKLFVTGAAVATVATEKKWDPHLRAEFEQWWGWHIENSVEISGMLETDDGRMTMDQFVYDRTRFYSEMCKEDDPLLRSAAIAAGFSRLCCGEPTNSTLTRIGESVYLFRGGELAISIMSLYKVQSS